MPSDVTTWPTGYDRCVLDEVDSTLDEARRRAADTVGPEWILAFRQTAARGRRGRPWASPRGNFAATLLMRPAEPPQHAALRSFVAALALYDALSDVSGRSESFAMKWPNDVLLNGGKVAGILLESAGRTGGELQLSIGIGVNLIAAPSVEEVEPGALRPVSLLSECGVSVTPEEFLTHLAARYALHEDRFVTFGFDPIRRAWLDRAAHLGEIITARVGPEQHRGRFADVDKDGQLVLETRDGRKTFPAADVFL